MERGLLQIKGHAHTEKSLKCERIMRNHMKTPEKENEGEAKASKTSGTHRGEETKVAILSLCLTGKVGT